MGMIPPGTSSYNWLRQQQLRKVSDTSGLQLTQLKATDPSKICGRQIDSSVAVGGVGNIPITSDTITPDMLQGHAFVAPTYQVETGNPNLLVNPTGNFGLVGWTRYDNWTLATISGADGVFTIACDGSGPSDSGLYQQLTKQTPGAQLTLSGEVAVSNYSGDAVAYVDLFDPNVGYIQQPVNLTANQAFTRFVTTFTVPADGLVLVRIRIYGGPSSHGALTAQFRNLKCEDGTVATPFLPGVFDAVAEVDISGALHTVLTSIGFTNIPTNQNGDGAATGIVWYYRNTNSTAWIPWAVSTIPGLPFPPKSQVLTFGFGQLAIGVAYDFGAAYVDLMGNVGQVSAFAVGYSPGSNLFQINSSYMATFGGTYTPAFLSAPALSSPLSVNGIASSVRMDFTIANQPQDGSLSRVSVWYRVTPPGGSSTPEGTDHKYTFYGSVPAVGVGLPIPQLPSQGTYSFTFADLTNQTSYDFAVSCEDSAGGETAIIYAATMTPQTIVLPNQALPTHPANTYVQAQAQSTQVGLTGNSSYYSQLTLAVQVTDGPGGAQIDPSGWLAQIRILAKPIASDQGSGDHDLNPNDYVVCNSIYTNTIPNPIIVTIGPFPGNQFQEIAVQLVDQAGKVSNADPFLITPPPAPVFDSEGHLSYTSYGTPIQQIITPSGTLQPGVVARLNMASPETGQNILFNPTGYFGTKFWYPAGGPGVPFFGTDQYAGGRFRMYYSGGQAMDYAEYQTISNLIPGLTMTISGLLEVDQTSTPGSYGGVDIFDPVTNQVLASNYVYGPQSATYFERQFTVPSSGAIQVRMRLGNGGGGGAVDAYYYKLQLEHGAPASPFTDTMGAAAAANTHGSDGTMIAVSNNFTNGEIDYNASPQVIRDVINGAGQYNAGLAAPGSAVPYDNINGAYQIATGRNGQFQNAIFVSANIPTNSLAIAVFPIVIPSGGTYQIFIQVNAFTNNAKGELTTYQPYNGSILPAGYTNAQNMFTFSPQLSGANPINGSFVCTGGQTIGVTYALNSLTGLTQPGNMTITGYKIT